MESHPVDKVSTEDDSAFHLGVQTHKVDGEDIDITTLSNQELIKQAEEFTEQLELEKAVALYDEGLRRFPNDTIILDQYTDLLLQLEEIKKARELIERSIQLNPNREGRKYLNFAEMLNGNESLQMYKKGIEVLKMDSNRYKQGLRVDDATIAMKHVASAHASIANIYMTDLSDEPNAEQSCEASLKDALTVDQNNIDALQSLANLRMVRSKDEEARIHLLKVFHQIQKLRETEESGNGAKHEQMPSLEFRLQTSRLLFELKEYKKCVKILDSIIQEEDEYVETWYLLAFCLCKLEKFTNAQECIKNVNMLIKKQKITNEEFLQGTVELQQTIEKELNGGAEDDDEQMQEGEEGGYETYSEEDVSDDEKDDAKMS